MLEPYKTISAQKKEDRENHKYEFGICRIRRRSEGGQSLDETLGSGFLIRDLNIPEFTFRLCLVTSDKVIAGHDFENYYVEFKKFNSAKMTKIELSEIASSEVHRTSRLIFIDISIDLIKKKKKFYKDISCRSFNVVRKRLGSYEDLFCYFVDDSQAEVRVKQMKIKQNDGEEFYVEEAHRTYSKFSQFPRGYPFGGVILKTIENELIVVGVLQFADMETVSPVFFPISSSEGKGKMPLNHFATGIENGITALKKGGQQEHTLQSNQGERDNQCATEAEKGRTGSLNGIVVEEKQKFGGFTSGSGGSDWWSYLKSWLPFQDNSDNCSDNGNLSLNLSGIGSFDITIDPPEIRLQGGGPCHFFFIPDLPSDISSGTAKFFGLHLGFVKLKGVKDGADCLVGSGIPSAEKEGWVTVGVVGKNDKTGKCNDLGQAKIYYYDERRKVLKQIVQNEEQLHDFFETWKTAYEGHSTAGRVPKTESPSSGPMDSDNPLHSLQGLMLLVYTAAETDARQFIELIFNSSAGRVVFNAYRCNSPLPEDVARDFGHEDTAQYLESISKRLSEDLSVNEEDLQASHILELADAVKNQSNYKVNYNREAVTSPPDEITNVASRLQEGTATAIITSYSTRSDDTPQPFEGSVDFDKNSLKDVKGKSVVSSREYAASSYNNMRPVPSHLGDLKQAKDCHERALGPQQDDLATSYDNLGLVHRQLGDLNQAEDCHKRAQDIRLKELGPEHVDLTRLYDYLGLVHRQLGDLKQAEHYHKRALDIRLIELGPQHIDIATSYYNLALVHRQLGGPMRAKDYHKPTLDNRLKELGLYYVDVATSYNNVALDHRQLGDLRRAKDYHKRALDIRLKELGPQHIDVATSYDNLDLVHRQLGDLKQTEDDHKRALDTGLIELGRQHIDDATSYDNLGLVQRQLGDLKQAEHFHKRALDIQLKELGPQHIHVATSYDNLGLVHRQLGDLKQAEDYHKRALEIRFKELGHQHIDVATSYDNLGLVHLHLGDLKQAEDYHKRALYIRTNELGPQHIDVATSYDNVGLVQRQQGDLKWAENYHKRALDIRLKELGPQHIHVATSYDNLGLVHRQLGDLKQAEDYHKRALETRLKELGPEHVYVATSYDNLGFVHLQLGDLKQAEDYHNRALEIRLKELAPEDVDVATSYDNLGLLHRQLGDLKQAEDYHKRALDIRLKELGPEDVDVATSYDNLGLVHRQLGDLKQAEDYHKRALEIRLKELGPEHIDVATSYDDLGLVHLQLGDLKQTKNYRKRALEIRLEELGDLKEIRLEDLKQAEDYHKRALEIRLKELGPGHVDVATSYDNLDWCIVV